ADVLAAQPVTTNLLKFMRASIKMIGVSNLQSFIASMTQKLTLSDISDESKNYLDKAGITTACRSEERFSRNAETDLVCRLLLEHTHPPALYPLSLHDALPICRRFGGATCDDKSAQIYARFDKNDWRIQPAEFYRFHDAEVNTFGYF